MAKVTARSTLAFDGKVIAKAGKEFDSKAVPAPILKDWVKRGLCSSPPKSATRTKTNKSVELRAANSKSDA
jgi:hypothetical protein